MGSDFEQKELIRRDFHTEPGVYRECSRRLDTWRVAGFGGHKSLVDGGGYGRMTGPAQTRLVRIKKAGVIVEAKAGNAPASREHQGGIRATDMQELVHPAPNQRLEAVQCQTYSPAAKCM